MTPAYRLHLRGVIADADAAELRASTPIAIQKIRLNKRIALMELDYLESGGVPTALSGLISLKI